MLELLIAANESFYEAFRTGDLKAMDALWAEKTEVLCAHPGRYPLRGRVRVMASWRAIMSGGPQSIRITDARGYLLGESAFVTCEERLPGARLLATNVFVREEERWRMVHHHSGLIQEPEPPRKPSSPLN